MISPRSPFVTALHVVAPVATGMARLAIPIAVVLMLLILVVDCEHYLHWRTGTIPELQRLLRLQQRFLTEVALRNQTKMPRHLSQHA